MDNLYRSVQKASFALISSLAITQAVINTTEHKSQEEHRVYVVKSPIGDPPLHDSSSYYSVEPLIMPPTEETLSTSFSHSFFPSKTNDSSIFSVSSNIQGFSENKTMIDQKSYEKCREAIAEVIATHEIRPETQKTIVDALFDFNQYVPQNMELSPFVSTGCDGNVSLEWWKGPKKILIDATEDELLVLKSVTKDRKHESEFVSISPQLLEWFLAE